MKKAMKKTNVNSNSVEVYIDCSSYCRGCNCNCNCGCTGTVSQISRTDSTITGNTGTGQSSLNQNAMWN